MIDLDAARALLAEVLGRVTHGDPAGPLHVYSRAVTGPLILPTAVIGIPDVEYGTQPCIDTCHLPVAVVVGRDGIDDDATQALLESLWLQTASVVGAAIDSGELLQVCAAAVLRSADYEPVGVQGTTHPAYTLVLDLHG